MIRPLRKLHRLIWPVLAIALPLVIVAGIHDANQRVRPLHQVAAPSTVSTPADVTINNAGFRVSAISQDNAAFTSASAIVPLETSTGRVSVFVVDDRNRSPRYIGSLAALRKGLLIDGSSSADRLALRFYDPVRQRWISDAITVQVAR